MASIKVNTNSLSVKLKEAREEAEAAMLDKVRQVGTDAVQASPVDTGAFVESWSILPKGHGGGRSKSSKTPARRAVSGKLSAGQKQAIKQKHITQALLQDINTHGETIIARGGAVVRNRAPHGQVMKPRNGMTLGKILAIVKDKNS